MGSRNNYHLLFTRAFLTSFNAELQNRRDNLTLSKAQISKFSNAVRNNIVDVAILPHSHKNIADELHHG